MSFEEFAKLLNRNAASQPRSHQRPEPGAHGLSARPGSRRALGCQSHFRDLPFRVRRRAVGPSGNRRLRPVRPVALRVVCEALIVYFEANKDAMPPPRVPKARPISSYEVRDAIEQLSENEKDEKALAELEAAKPLAKSAAPAKTGATKRVYCQNADCHKPPPSALLAPPNPSAHCQAHAQAQGRQRRRLTAKKAPALTFAGKAI